MVTNKVCLNANLPPLDSICSWIGTKQFDLCFEVDNLMITCIFSGNHRSHRPIAGSSTHMTSYVILVRQQMDFLRPSFKFLLVKDTFNHHLRFFLPSSHGTSTQRNKSKSFDNEFTKPLEHKCICWTH